MTDNENKPAAALEDHMFSKYCSYCKKHGHTDAECWCTRAVPFLAVQNDAMNHWRARAEAAECQLAAIRSGLIDPVNDAIAAMDLARSSHALILTSDPPKDAWRYRNCDGHLRSASDALRAKLELLEKPE